MESGYLYNFSPTIQLDMQKRRTFLKNSAGLTLGAFLSGGLLSCNGNGVRSDFRLKEYGIQLWTVKEFMEKDPKGTLEQLAEYGYDTIESFGGSKGILWGMKVPEMKKFLADNGLKMVSSHCDSGFAFNMGRIDEFRKLVDDCGKLGVKYLVNPYMGNLENIEQFRVAAGAFNILGEICRTRNITYCYHNHDYTYMDMNGYIPQEVLLKGTDPDIVGFQMDLYWVVAAGEDPVKWLEKYPGRYPISHVKDRYKQGKLEEIAKEDGTEKPNKINGSCVLGEGQIDFDKILSVAKKNGMKEFFVEQERFDGMTAMEAANKDARFMDRYLLKS